MDEFATAFGDADTLFILDVYPASEVPIEGVTGEALAERIRQQTGRDATYEPSFADAAQAAVSVADEGDMIMTFGAGSVFQLGSSILELLQAKQPLAAQP
jgi:UDP-N-acetylmuramate--alanine ligase